MKPDILKGIRVVDFTTYVAAPAATRIMADWGADVIKVEAPGGDLYRGYGAQMDSPIDEDKNPIYLLKNCNKKGLGLNLKNPEGMEAMHKLIASAEIFVTNVRMNSLKNLGLDYETLHAKYPKLVYGFCGGYGLYGEESGRPGFDIVTFWARGGMMADLPPIGHPPISIPSGVGDNATGLALLCGCMAALIKARATGMGEMVVASLYNTAIYVSDLMITSTQFNDKFPKSRYAVGHPLSNTYQTKDGEWFAFAMLQYEKMFPKLCKVLGLDQYAEDERYCTLKTVKTENHVEEFCKILEEAMAKYDSAYITKEFSANDLTFERCHHFSELSSDKQALENHYLKEYTFKDGSTVQLPADPVQFMSNEIVDIDPAPAVGEHNDEILAGLGYSAAQIAAMMESGAIVDK